MVGVWEKWLDEDCQWVSRWLEFLFEVLLRGG